MWLPVPPPTTTMFFLLIRQPTAPLWESETVSVRLLQYIRSYRNNHVSILSEAMECQCRRTPHQGLFKVVEIKHPLVLSLSKDDYRWFNGLRMGGVFRTKAATGCQTGQGNFATRDLTERWTESANSVTDFASAFRLFQRWCSCCPGVGKAKRKATADHRHPAALHR